MKCCMHAGLFYERKMVKSYQIEMRAIVPNPSTAQPMILELANLGTGTIHLTGEKMKLLVTGGLGFIGSNFIRHMLKKHGFFIILQL